MEILNKTQFKAKCDSLRTAQQKQDELIHLLACNAIYHSIKDGQITPANQLINSMGRSSRKNDVITYLCHFGNLAWNDKDKTIKHKKRHEQNETAALLILDECESQPFWTIVKEQKVKTEWDMAAALANLVRAYRQHHAKGHTIKVSAEDQKLLDNLVARYPAKA